MRAVEGRTPYGVRARGLRSPLGSSAAPLPAAARSEERVPPWREEEGRGGSLLASLFDGADQRRVGAGPEKSVAQVGVLVSDARGDCIQVGGGARTHRGRRSRTEPVEDLDAGEVDPGGVECPLEVDPFNLESPETISAALSGSPRIRAISARAASASVTMYPIDISFPCCRASVSASSALSTIAMSEQHQPLTQPGAGDCER